MVCFWFPSKQFRSAIWGPQVATWLGVKIRRVAPLKCYFVFKQLNTLETKENYKGRIQETETLTAWQLARPFPVPFRSKRRSVPLAPRGSPSKRCPPDRWWPSAAANPARTSLERGFGENPWMWSKSTMVKPVMEKTTNWCRISPICSASRHQNDPKGRVVKGDAHIGCHSVD